MTPEILELLCCPNDGHSPLEFQSTDSSGRDNRYGVLLCQACSAQFPVEDGIGRFLQLTANPLDDIKRKELVERDNTYRGSRPRRPGDFGREWERYPEYDAVKAAVGDCRERVVLDAGCGVGKMTQAAADARMLVGVDFSFEAMRNFYLRDRPGTVLIQGDVCRMPVRPGSFDLVMSWQVLEHIPSQKLRRDFLHSLSDAARPGGRIVLSVYNWSRNRSESGFPKEGFHPNEIFYHCYSAEQLRAELTEVSDVRAIWGVQVVMPATYRFVRFLGKYSTHWDRIWRRTSIGRLYGSLLLAIAEKH